MSKAGLQNEDEIKKGIAAAEYVKKGELLTSGKMRGVG